MQNASKNYTPIKEMMFIVFVPEQDYYKPLIDGINSHKDAVVFSHVALSRPFDKFSRRLYLSAKVNKFFAHPFKSYWHAYNDSVLLDTITKNYKNSNVVLVILENSMLGFDETYFDYLKRRFPNLRLVFQFTNPASDFKSNFPRMFNYIINKFDFVVTFDANDSKKYGFGFCRNASGRVSERSFLKKPLKEDIDVFFIGAAKNRLKLLHKAYLYLTALGLNCSFHITDVDKKDMLRGTNIIYNKRLPYEATLDYVKRSRCILEILQSTQSGATIRAGEAIAYGKKLLTNNREFKGSPLYHPAQMMVFNNIADVTADFVLNGSKEGFASPDALDPYGMIEYIKKHFEGQN